MALLPTTGASVWDFGNDYLTGLATDGNDMGVLCARPTQITGIVYRADANPAQTLTITLSKNGVSTATLTVATNGALTLSGFPFSCAASDRLIVAMAGTANVTGISYTVKAQSFGN